MISEQTHPLPLRPSKRFRFATTWTTRLTPGFDSLDIRITTWMARHGITLARIALGLVFLWFGIIKFVPSWSPAEELATRTIGRITFGLLTPGVSLPMLATLETVIGIGFLTGRHLRVTLILLFAHMAGTFLPLMLFPNETFRAFPYAPTLEGQYILKNLVLIAAGIVVGATVRGGRLTHRAPEESEETIAPGRPSA